jgi:hypothetical protein
MKLKLNQLGVDIILAVVISMQITGCATTEELQFANDPGRYRLFVPASEQITTNARLPSLPSKVSVGFAVNYLVHFPQSVEGRIEWSNGYQEKMDLRWNAENERTYALLLMELNPDQDSTEVTLKVDSLGDELLVRSRERPLGEQALSLAVGFVVLLGEYILLIPVVLPLLMYHLITEKTQFPFPGCCFMWIADVETGKTVAGVSPEGAKIVFPILNPQKAPTGEPS